MKADQYKDRILQLWNEGSSVETISKDTGLHQITIRKAMAKWGISVETRRARKVTDTEVLAALQTAGSRTNTARLLGVHEATVDRAVSKAKSKAAATTIEDPTAGVSPTAIKNHRRFVVTSALNNCDVHHPFLESLKTYCAELDAQLLVIPVAYKNISLFDRNYEPSWPSELSPYYITGDLELSSNLVIMGSMRIQATAAKPLQGIGGISKGKSAIFGHPKLALEMVPTPMTIIPSVYMTSGTVSKPSYSNTKAGRLGEFHHDLGATVVETDGTLFWWRHIHPDKFGNFIDLDKQYGPKGAIFPAPPAEAIIVGDVHVGFDDPGTVHAIMGQLHKATKAKNVVLHDLLDFFSASHHHISNNVLRVLKSARGRDDVHGELKSVAEWLDKWCKDGTTYHIIRSNHHDHLDKWLNTHSSNVEANNLWLWHELNAKQLRKALDTAKSNLSKWGVSSAFELAMETLCKEDTKLRFRFQDDRSPLEFCGIDCSNHGDKGPNGSRGSKAGFSRVLRKTFIGHSHTPGIDGGAYQVGKSSIGEAYLGGYSSHLHCSGIIYGDGNRSLLPIINGRYCIGDK